MRSSTFARTLVESARFARVQNVKLVLRSLFVQLSTDAAPSDGVIEDRRRALAAVTAMP